MNGILVGNLEKNKNGSVRFNYDENWLNLPRTRPVSLSLPLIDKTFMGEVLYNFFDNLLPDNPNMRSRIQTKFHAKRKLLK